MSEGVRGEDGGGRGREEVSPVNSEGGSEGVRE